MQVGSAVNVAVIEQVPPAAVNPVNEYGIDVAKGGFMVIGDPPHEFEMVNVPVEGGFVAVMVPFTLYVPEAGSQGPGVALIPLNVHRIAQLVAPAPPVWVAMIFVG